MTERVTITGLEEGVFQLKMDDPELENRLSGELAADLVAALDRLEQEPSLKVLLLAGRREVFSAGGSLDLLDRLVQGTLEEKSLFVLPNRVLHFPVPVIGVLEGHAVGGGLMLALCCDLIVAATNSRYGVNFTDLGFTPGLGTTTLLPALIAPVLAREMIFTAKLFRGSELRDRGLFNYVVPAAEVPEVALDLARRIAPKPRHVLEMLKDSLALPRRLALQEAMTHEQLMHRVCFSRPDTARHIHENYLIAQGATPWTASKSS
ncbi:polyketide synthase [Anthocerotibacter panamensis]|uniref:polyketide synthase n=1 Tax=Anthocerotibacter panamensis TaxID=2857077 RepID=UPI001C4051E7|nr:polyketide synthase [Anthocerotibacter panamensis]